MARFHVNGAGEPGICKAQKPGSSESQARGCPYGDATEHYDSKEEARTAFEKKMESESVPEGKSTARKATRINHFSAEAKAAKVDRAAEVDLTYTGKTPRWMSSAIKEAKSTFGSTPEIIDVIDSPEGKLAVVWEPHSLAKNDSNMPERGYVVTRVALRNMKTGEVRGYLKTTHVDDESVKIAFGEDGYESLRYMSDASGSNYGTYRWEKNGKKNKHGREMSDQVDVIQSASTHEELIEAKRQIWAASHRAENLGIEVDGKYKAPYNISDSDAPTDEKQLDKDLRKITRQTDKKVVEFKETHGNPYIDYSSVENELKGTGIGSALYVYSARMHAKKDRSIRGSTLQSDSAQAVWARFAKNDKLPVKKVTRINRRTGERTESYSMDFRSGPTSAAA